eukprot:1514999-Alexandrium_andersonii.AAC.1
MSASLVGSEMCIRDSQTNIWGRAGSPSGGRATQPSPLGRQSGCSGCPVSYTHLTLPTICSV